MSSSDEDDALAASFMRSIWGDGPSRPPTPPEAPPPQDVSFTFGDFTVTLVAGPANPGRTLSMIIWRGSLVMARAMLAMFSRGELGSDRTVLELGAGRGLCGLLAHQMGSSVCTTDCSYDGMVALLPSALLALAGPAAVGYKWGETGGELELRRHLWESDLPRSPGRGAPRHWSTHPACAFGPAGRCPDLEPELTYDVLIASDCLYFTSQVTLSSLAEHADFAPRPRQPRPLRLGTVATRLRPR
mmetsp:Transcript_44722/g.140830  ORF Transcript_44722/g.140830 Transcript_44722/m.140830 type:complete len:244 (-) Transcript_44722:425-1156(-)